MEHRSLTISPGQIVILTTSGLEISTLEESGVYYAIPKAEVAAGAYPVSMYWKATKEAEWERMSSELIVTEDMELMYVNDTRGKFLSTCFEIDATASDLRHAPPSPPAALPVTPSLTPPLTPVCRAQVTPSPVPVSSPTPPVKPAPSAPLAPPPPTALKVAPPPPVVKPGPSVPPAAAPAPAVKPAPAVPSAPAPTVPSPLGLKVPSPANIKLTK